MSSITTAAITFAQHIGIGTATPNSSAIVEVQSNNKGVLVPRVANRFNIANPATGLLIFETDSKAYWYFSNPTTGWKELTFSLPKSYTVNSNATLFEIANTSPSSSQPTLSITSTGGNAIKGNADNTYSGVFGQNDDNGKGVSGLNNGTGHGVHARGANGTALFADIVNNGMGTAARFKQTNVNGRAVEVEGNLSITGGNTNPGPDRVLTSDAYGNATWQSAPRTTPRRGFEARGMAANGANVQYRGAWIKYHPAIESFDAGGDFRNINQVPSSTFVVPVAGVYEINAMIKFPMLHFDDRRIRIVLERGGLKTILAHNGENNAPGDFQHNGNSMVISTTAKLNVTDLVYVEFYFYNEVYGPIAFTTESYDHYFTMALMDTSN